jgi:hypothetical protein
MYAERGKRYTSYYMMTIKNKYVGLGRDLIAAKQEYYKIMGDVVPSGTIAEWISIELNALEKLVQQGKRSRRTYDDRKNLDAPHLIEVFGKMAPEHLKRKHIWEFLHETRGVDAPVRANKEISFLQVVMDRCANKGIIDVNPCVGVDRCEENPRTRLVSDTELTDFIKLARELTEANTEARLHGKAGDSPLRAALAFHLAFLTGKGQGQILALKRHQLTEAGIEFYVGRKGGASTLVEWTEELRAVVAESMALPAKISTMFIVHSQAGTHYTRGGFKGIWHELMTKWVSGGNWKDGSVREKGERFHFHDSRAKAISTLKEEGRNASELTGHRLESTVSKVYDRRRIRKSKAVR